jgi:hypothetical protein
MSLRYSAVAIIAGIAVLLAFVLSKSLLVGQFWFHGVDHWLALFRPYPDWGSGAELYGGLLPSKWLGTRSLGAAIGMFAALATGFSVRAYRLAALVACEAAAIELLDALWLTIGEQQGWITAATNQAIVTDLCWTLLLLAAAWLLWGRDEPAPLSRPAKTTLPFSSLARFLDRYFIYLCYAVALVYAGMKLLFAYWWWFDSIGFWLAAFRPFLDWGTGADLFGALLPARMIGNRNLAFGLFIVFALWYAVRRHDHRLLAILLLQGAVIELFDGFWLANGKYNMLWVGQNTDFFMNGGFIWVADLMLAGVYILSRDRPHQPAELVI